MYSWLTEPKIPLGSWIKTFVDFLNLHAQWLFDFISLVLGSLIDGLTDLLILTPPLNPPLDGALRLQPPADPPRHQAEERFDR